MRRIIAVTALLLAGAGIAYAQEADPIETRQAGQDLLGGDFAGIRAVVVAKGDVKTVEGPAKALARWIRQFPSQFPKGTEEGHNTKALPAIWSDPAGFKKAGDDMADAADKLAVAAKANDADGVATQVKAVADACGACHRTFRAK